jgi:ribosomal protein L24E
MKNQPVNTQCCYCKRVIEEGEGRYLVVREDGSVYSCVDCYRRQSFLNLPFQETGKTVEEVHCCHACKKNLKSGNLSSISINGDNIVYFCSDCARETLET